jgi:hypothetical protein
VRLWGWDQVTSEPLPQEALQICSTDGVTSLVATTENCVRWYVFVFVFHRTKHGNTVLHQGLREIFVLKTEGEAVGEQNRTVGSCMFCIGE